MYSNSGSSSSSSSGNSIQTFPRLKQYLLVLFGRRRLQCMAYGVVRPYGVNCHHDHDDGIRTVNESSLTGVHLAVAQIPKYMNTHLPNKHQKISQPCVLLLRQRSEK